ncbi:MAG: cytochrome C [Thermodesulfovibrio sp.]|nr:cytochrome C [Thermodesulfovibrio sp.]
MKKSIIFLSVCVLLMMSAAARAGESQKISGENAFKEHCAACHPDGGNIVNPQKTLHKKDREANKVKTAADIIGKMRNPGPGMSQFDKKTVSDEEAGAIANYILKTFK